MKVRFQATGELHLVIAQSDYPGDDARIVKTKCGLRVALGGPVGKMAIDPPKTTCRECFERV